MTRPSLPRDSLPATDAHYRALFEQCSLGMARAQFSDGRWLEVNAAFCQMLGRTPEEMLVACWPEMTHPDDIKADLVNFERMAAGQLNAYSLEKRLLHKDGHYIWTKLHLSVVRDASGDPDYEMAVIEDIRDRKAAEEELVQSRLKLEAERAWFKAIVDTIPTGLIMLDASGAMILENAEWKKTWAGNAIVDSAVDYDAYKGFRPDTGERIDALDWPCALSLKQGISTRDVVLDIERLNGTRGTIVVSSSPILDRDGNIVGAVAANMDITELRAAQARLVEADKRKDEFLAMLAHELRGPMSAIVNTVQLLTRQTTEDSARTYLAILTRQSEVLGGLVNDLLDVSRITRGLIELKHERLDVGALVNQALETVQSLMDEKGHTLSVTLPRKIVEVTGDPVRFEQILVNLLTNAAKYTDPEGRIALTLEQCDEQACIRVRDNGIGIANDMRDRIFDLFAQANGGLARSQGGLGIGLTIVRSLVQLHKGKIEVLSEGLGHGAEFTVSFPIAAPQARAARTFQQQPLPAVQPGGKRVLVVDDNPDIAETLALLLEHFGHTVTVAHDGPAALQKAEEVDPEVILLDIGLPGMDGYEVARRLRKDPRLGHVILAAVTGYGQDQDRRVAIEAGFNKHFTKPVDIDALNAYVTSAKL